MLNKAQLIGSLGKDPDIRKLQSNTVANFSLATTERRKDETGNWVNFTEWHNVVCWGKAAENVEKYLKKGKTVYIEGRLRTEKWHDKEGVERYTTKIHAHVVVFLSPKDDSAQTDSIQTQTYDSSFGPDDDIPF